MVHTKPKYVKMTLLWMGPVLLSAFSLLLGLMPNRITSYLNNAIYHIQANEYQANLTIWHGFNTELILSIATVSIGVILFVKRKWVSSRISYINDKLNSQFYMPDLFEKLIKSYVKLAARQTNRIQHGYHRYYLMTFFIITVIAVSIGLYPFNFQAWDWPDAGIKLHIIILLAIMAFGLFFAVISNSRISAILALGIVGYGIGLIYLFYGAVDLAITQFLVETLIMVLFILVIEYLPVFANLSVRSSRRRDAIIATVVGVFVTIVVLEARFINVSEPISHFFIDNSLTQAFGRNIVNVILVDFRALDTLGEITVLALAASGVVALVSVGQKSKSGHGLNPSGAIPTEIEVSAKPLRNMVIVQIVTWVRRVLVVFSVILLVRGHNAPGGGFIGGIIAASGYLFYAIIFGSTSTRRVLRMAPFTFIGIGLSFAIVSALMPLLSGLAPLTGLWVHFTLPLIGEIHLGTPLLFDAGVFLVVFGMINAIVLTIMDVMKWN